MDFKQFSFESWSVWDDIRQLIKSIYSISSNFPENEKFGLVNQMRRSSISVGSNLSEGSSRTSSKDQAHFYQISFSSIMELLSQIIVSKDLNLINEKDYYELRKEIEKIAFKLNALRNSAINRAKLKTSKTI